MVKQKLIAIVGPTGSGKTEYSLLRQGSEGQAQQVEIVSADSRQVYRGMDIGTAKVRDTKGIPHHLIDIRQPSEPITLAEWQRMAFEAIDDILARGRTPLLVGGTMLYIDSVVFNYQIPNVPPNPRYRKLKSQISKHKLYDELLKQDPEAEKFIQPGNMRRIIRALEVIETTGRRYSEQRKAREPRYDVEMIGIFPHQVGGQAGWDKLKERIENRAGQMLAEGLMEEIQALKKMYGANLPLLQTINYKQAMAVLDGKMTEEEAWESMIRDNMRYARRQMSWWKGREEIKWICM